MGLLKYKIHCETEGVDQYWWLPSTSPAPTKCPNDTAHTCTAGSVAVIGSDIPLPNPKANEDNRDLIAVNRIPAGYTIYNTSKGDAIDTGVLGGGPALKMITTSAEAKKCILQMKEHFYAIGGRALWSGCGEDDLMNAYLVAPASTGFTQEAGNFNKVQVAPGMNMIVPAAPGAGAWKANLADKLNANVPILKATPVPQAGNNGFFDYDSTTNTLSVNAAQKGGYNLYDFPINLFRFTNGSWAKPDKGHESVMETTDVVGKLLFNCWQIHYHFISETENAAVRVLMTLAVKKSI